MTRVRSISAPSGERVRVNVSLDGDALAALDVLADADGRDRSHELDALIRAETERRRRREKR